MADATTTRPQQPPPEQPPPHVGRLAGLRRAQWAMGVGAAAVVGGLVAFGVRPAAADLWAANGRVAVGRADVAVGLQRVAALPAVTDSVRQLRRRVDRFDKLVPHEQDLAGFIGDLTRAGRAAGLGRIAWRPDAKPLRSDRYTELPIRVSFGGDFRTGLCAFLHDLDAMPRLTRVRQMTVTAVPGGAGRVEVEMTVSVYFAEE